MNSVTSIFCNKNNVTRVAARFTGSRSKYELSDVGSASVRLVCKCNSAISFVKRSRVDDVIDTVTSAVSSGSDVPALQLLELTFVFSCCSMMASVCGDVSTSDWSHEQRKEQQLPETPVVSPVNAMLKTNKVKTRFIKQLN